MDISYCGDKTGFPRPGHIYILCTFWCGLIHLDPFHVHLDPFHVYLDPFHVYLDPFCVYKQVNIFIGLNFDK